MTDAVLQLILRLKDEASAVADQAKGKLSGLQSALGGVATVAGGAALAGVLAFGAGVVGGMNDAREAAGIMAQTEQTITSMGNAAGLSAQDVADFAGSLSAASGASLFGDSQVQQASNLLLTFGEIKGETFKLATALTVDLAQALGGEPQSQAMMLGKALNDPINGISALGRAGLTFSDDQKAMIARLQETGDMAGAQAIIINELNKQVGGSAQAAAIADGGMAQFNDRVGELWESIGARLIPVATKLVGFLNDSVMPVLEENVGPALDWIGAEIIPALMQAFEAARPHLERFADFFMTRILPALQALWSFTSTYILPILGMLGSLIGQGLVMQFEGLGRMIDAFLGGLAELNRFVEWSKSVLQSWADGFRGVIDRLGELRRWFDEVRTAAASLAIPDWLTPGSPTPLEIGIGGIRDELRALSRSELPQIRAGFAMDAPPLLGGVAVGAGSGGGTLGGGMVIQNLTITIPATLLDPRSQALAIRDELIRIANQNGSTGL